jgi:hypothetical protein
MFRYFFVILFVIPFAASAQDYSYWDLPRFCIADFVDHNMENNGKKILVLNYNDSLESIHCKTRLVAEYSDIYYREKGKLTLAIYVSDIYMEDHFFVVNVVEYSAKIVGKKRVFSNNHNGLAYYFQYDCEKNLFMFVKKLANEYPNPNARTP